MREIFVKRTDHECFYILKICQDVLSKFEIEFDIEKIRSTSRESRLVFIRALIAAYLRKRDLSYNDIAIVLNRKSHATIMNLIRYAEKSQGRDFRWETISKSLSGGTTKYEIEEKIRWHQNQIVLLSNQSAAL